MSSAVCLVAADTLARSVAAIELPLGILTAGGRRVPTPHGSVLQFADKADLTSLTPAAERSNRSRTRLMDPPAQALRDPSSGQPRSKRSRFITLVHATTKSLTNFSCASEQA